LEYVRIRETNFTCYNFYFSSGLCHVDSFITVELDFNRGQFVYPLLNILMQTYSFIFFTIR